jgi:hypothetical protein
MTGPKHALVLLGALAVALALAATAGAAGLDPIDDPVIKEEPNLVISSASVVPDGTSAWEIRYTVANRGGLATPAFHVALRGASIPDEYHSSLAPGASLSRTISIRREDCYIPVRLLADATHLVFESNEFDNGRVTVGLTDASCRTQPHYRVNAVKFTAVDESGIDWTGSDEPYFKFKSIDADGAQHSWQTHVFGDIDTGDTAQFGAEGCIYLTCVGGAAPNGIRFTILALEADLGAEDLIGSQTYVYDPAFLASKLVAVATTFEDVRIYSDGDAVYAVTVRVARV